MWLKINRVAAEIFVTELLALYKRNIISFCWKCRFLFSCIIFLHYWCLPAIFFNTRLCLILNAFDSVVVLCMLYKSRCNPMHAPSLWCSTWAVCSCADYTYVVLWSRIGTLMSLLAAESRSTASLSFSCQNLFDTILVTPYEMVWDWRFSRAGPLLSIGLAARSPFLLSLVLWGWGLRTDRVLIALSQQCIANVF